MPGFHQVVVVTGHVNDEEVVGLGAHRQPAHFAMLDATFLHVDPRLLGFFLKKKKTKRSTPTHKEEAFKNQDHHRHRTHSQKEKEREGEEEVCATNLWQLYPCPCSCQFRKCKWPDRS